MKDKIKGMQDKSLAVTPQEVDKIVERTTLFRHDHMHMENGRLVEDAVIERTPLAQQEFRGLRDQWDTYTREELLRVRAELKDLSQPKHHPKTPLPLPPQ